MATTGTVIQGRVFTALNSATVSSQSGMTLANWTANPHVFYGFTGFLAGRNRGRLPFIEFDVSTDGFTQNTVEGGTLIVKVTLRIHVGGRDTQVAGNLAEALTLASLAAIRSESVDNYFALGDDSMQQIVPGPWGWVRESSLTVQLTYGRGNYEIVNFG